MVDIRSTSAILKEYQGNIERLQNRIADSHRRQVNLLLFAICGAILFAVILYTVLAKHLISPVISVIPLIGTVWALREYFRFRGVSLDLAHRSSFYERGIDRLQGTWRGKGVNGMDYVRENHLYQSDLTIIGDGSLFEFICTTRSEVGAERLASFLLDPTELNEAQARQEAVNELRDIPCLREEIATLGKYQFLNCNGMDIRDWLSSPLLEIHIITPIFLFISSIFVLIFGILGMVGYFTLSHLALVLMAPLITQVCICLILIRQVRPRLKKLRRLTNEFSVLRQGVSLMQRQHFHSAKLCKLLDRICYRDAAANIKILERLVHAIQRREDEVLYGFSLWLAVGTQLVLAVERWRIANQNDFVDWLDAWAEFDALNALACYSYEHPTDEFPELLEGVALFEAENLCHPLLPNDECVANDVALNGFTRFYLISGSNMAGKSTFLRAIGVNAVLALAGAPVRAQRPRISVFDVCASISINDSLYEGKSKFLAEVERLRDMLLRTESGRPVLFLIDEILSGTNSRDRGVAANSVVKALIKGGAVGALSTHDLALTEIADDPELKGANVHMQSQNPENPLDFDYRVKPGITQQTNALAIVRLMGINL